MRNEIKAILTEEERQAAEEETLERVRAALRIDPERFFVRSAAPARPCPRPKRDKRRTPPDPLRSAGQAAVPSRLPWEKIVRPKARPVRVRTVPETLPAEQLASRVKTLMKEQGVSQERLARALYCSPVTLRRWFASPGDMTIRDYRALAAWAAGNQKSTPAARKGGCP